MAEKGIVVADAASGESIATRDAFVNDESGNPRVIQRFDLASGRCSSPIGTANRGETTAVSSADSTDITNLSGDITGNLVDVGDNSVLVVIVEQSATDGSVSITPIMFDGESTPNVIGCLPTLSTGVTALRRGSSSGNFISPVMTWDLSGTHKIGIHITSISGTSNAVKVFAYTI